MNGQGGSDSCLRSTPAVTPSPLHLLLLLFAVFVRVFILLLLLLHQVTPLSSSGDGYTLLSALLLPGEDGALPLAAKPEGTDGGEALGDEATRKAAVLRSKVPIRYQILPVTFGILHEFFIRRL